MTVMSVEVDEDYAEEVGVCEYPTSVWIDPGSTTGWSVITVHPHALSVPDVPVLSNVTYWEQGQFFGSEDDVEDQICDLVAAWPEAAVGAEDFILRRFGMDREGLSPVRLNAILKRELRLQGRVMHLQQPSMAKTAVTDDRLKMWGFYRSEGGEGHARDATRHALCWLRRAAAADRRGARLRGVAWPYHYASAGVHVGTYLGDLDDEACAEGKCACKPQAQESSMS